MERMQNFVANERRLMQTWPAGQTRDDKKYELLELEEQGFLRDDAFHEAVTEMGKAKALKDDGQCTKARKHVEKAIKVLKRVHGTESKQFMTCFYMHGSLCETQSDYFNAKQSYAKALKVARILSLKIHPRSTSKFFSPGYDQGYVTQDVKRCKAACDRIDFLVAKRWSGARGRKREDDVTRKTLIAQGYTRGGGNTEVNGRREGLIQTMQASCVGEKVIFFYDPTMGGKL